jgi:glycerol-3-phosphate acyltransferase PlsY
LYFLLFLLAFFIGAIPSGFIIGLIYGVDIRSHGSGNIGATNLKRVLGKKAGALTLVADLSKGALAAGVGLFAEFVIGLPNTDYLGPLLGTAGVYGHCYSPFLRFQGGKGVAAALGAFLVLAPLAAIISAGTFLVIYKLTKYVSAGSLAGAIAFPLCVGLIDFDLSKAGALIAAVLISLLILVRHSENIKRLSQGTELSA